jgi:hypothetical protein
MVLILLVLLVLLLVLASVLMYRQLQAFLHYHNSPIKSPAVCAIPKTVLTISTGFLGFPPVTKPTTSATFPIVFSVVRRIWGLGA